MGVGFCLILQPLKGYFEVRWRQEIRNDVFA
jgi:hypothetical protein